MGVGASSRPWFFLKSGEFDEKNMMKSIKECGFGPKGVNFILFCSKKKEWPHLFWGK